MSEEKVTIYIINWLKTNGWEIICYDFPQSGTGILLKPNSKEKQGADLGKPLPKEKNKNGVIPDIIAVKDEVVLWFENKNRFYLPDFQKLQSIKALNIYSSSLQKILNSKTCENIYYGIGIPNNAKILSKSLAHKDMVDFIISCDENGQIEVNEQKTNIF